MSDCDDKLALRMAWMLVTVKTCAVYLAESYPIEYRECGLKQHEDEMDRLIEESAPLLLGKDEEEN